MKIKIITVLVSSFLLASCTDSIKNITTNYKLNNKSGVILLSLTASGECGYAFFTEIRNVDNRKTYSVGMQDFGSQRDWIKNNSECPSNENNFYGKLVVIELPAGNYEVYKLDGITTNSKISSKSEMSVKFTVFVNKINYLGNLHFHIKKEIFSYSVNDNSERDILLFQKKYKQFNIQDIIKNMLRIKKEKTLTARI